MRRGCTEAGKSLYRHHPASGAAKSYCTVNTELRCEVPALLTTLLVTV
jgi:hypothetical protein